MISSSEQKEPTEVSSGIEGLRQGNNANYMPHLTQPGGAPNRERRRNTAFSLVEIRASAGYGNRKRLGNGRERRLHCTPVSWMVSFDLHGSAALIDTEERHVLFIASMVNVDCRFVHSWRPIIFPALGDSQSCDTIIPSFRSNES